MGDASFGAVGMGCGAQRWGEWGWGVGMNCSGAEMWGCTELGGVGLGCGAELQWGWDVGMNCSGAGMWG